MDDPDMFTPRKKGPFRSPPDGERKPKKLRYDGEMVKNLRATALATYNEVNKIVTTRGDFNILQMYVDLSNDYLMNASKSLAQKFGCLWYFSWLLNEKFPSWVGDTDTKNGHAKFVLNRVASEWGTLLADDVLGEDIWGEYKKAVIKILDTLKEAVVEKGSNIGDFDWNMKC